MTYGDETLDFLREYALYTVMQFRPITATSVVYWINQLMRELRNDEFARYAPIELVVRYVVDCVDKEWGYCAGDSQTYWYWIELAVHIACREASKWEQ
jgi:hypothetical protein